MLMLFQTPLPYTGRGGVTADSPLFAITSTMFKTTKTPLPGFTIGVEKVYRTSAFLALGVADPPHNSTRKLSLHYFISQIFAVSSEFVTFF